MTSRLAPQSNSRGLQSVPLLISFSGIDGAGKTTQIDALTTCLEDAGLRVHVIRFWDDVATLRRLRETLGHALFRGEVGVGAPGKPVRRRDKDVHSWYMLPVRMALCLFDACRLRRVIRHIRQQTLVDVAIFDRYVYDQLANLDTRGKVALNYLQWLLRFAPRPDIAFLLDADPELARARKPEYPLAFLHTNRACYLDILALAEMVLIPPGPPDETAGAIHRELAGRLGFACPNLTPAITST